MIFFAGSIDWKPKGSSSNTFSPDPPVPEEKRREIMEREKVWVSHPIDGFILGRIVDLSEDGATVQPVDRGKKTVTNASFDRLYPAEDDDNKMVDDNCGLMYLNEATLLNNIRLRYDKDKIYTYVANILIAINPYYEIRDLYSATTIKCYQGRSLGTMPPHVFAIADKAFRDMKVLKQSQSVIVSGESGAGKTESTKYILKYLCDNFGHRAGALEQKILNANPILEAFGNAKTTRNNNSSRFGKFIEIHFDGQCRVVGGYISHYLLERARVVSQSPEERNYHIFYQLCAGAPKDLFDRLKLDSPDKFRYLNFGCTQYFCGKETEKSLKADRKSAEHKEKGALRDPIIDDIRNFVTVDEDLKKLGMSDGERLSIYTTIAIVLHLGNVDFEDDPDDNRGGCRVTDGSERSLQITSALMGLDPDELRRALTARVMQTAKGGYKGTVIMVPLKTHEASSARDALAKAIYSRLFDFIVKRINESIPFEKSSYYIGVLDIAGFEYFTVNSFEQFCINYCNEKLQQFFNQRILKDEQDLYEREGLGVKKISFVDNQDCIDLVESKGQGIFSLLDEESKLPKPSHQHFTSAVHNNNGGHFRLALPRKSKLREHRELRDDDGFLIRHFAGAVCYQTQQFIEKNNDALHASLEALVHEGKNKFLEVLFKHGQEASALKGKLAFLSVGSKFKSQLGDLMEKLRSTGTSFIRCIKPNVKMVAHSFEGGSILSQLQCAGMTSVLELMQQGYPSRTSFAELYSMYKRYLPPELARLDSRLFCKALFKALGLDDNDFKFGLTKVFFRPGKFAEFDQMLKSDPENLRKLIEKVKRWILCSQWKKAQWCALSVIKLKNKIIYRRNALIVIQKWVRMYLVRKQHAHRFKGILRLKTLIDQIERIGAMSDKLKKDRKDTVLKNVEALKKSLNSEITKIRATPKIQEKDINKVYEALLANINKEVVNVKKKIQEQKNAEEQEKLRRLQDEMEAEKRRKAEEERAKAALEEERKLKADMEAKRKEEESLVAKHLEAERKRSMEVQRKLNEENALLREQIEQERRDHELALRLAQESNSSIDDLHTPQLPRPSPVGVTAPTSQQALATAKKYDLSKWKYAELRDTINTSCDIDLLEACREEFHRRLKVYHAWKAKNKKKGSDQPAGGGAVPNTFDESMRAPSSVLEEAKKTPLAQQVRPIIGANQSQRYFRIPFVRPPTAGLENPAATSAPKGWWYAHFDGDWIGRQMELHPDKAPILLVAGQNDMQMCELRLEETGLTRKRGAEILETEFEREWNRNGGAAYVRPAERQQNRK